MRSTLAWKTIVATLALLLTPHLQAVAQQPVSEQELAIAHNVSRMLQSARAVISSKQDLINDPAGGDKGLTGKVVLDEALARFREAGGADPATIDPSTYEGRLLKALMDSVVEVVDDNQETINAQGIGFKGFIPATFARLVTEAFSRRVGDEASIKVTAPPELVRNRQSRPDEWEAAAIRDYLQSVDWPKGQVYSGHDEAGGKIARIMIPEYYAESCLTCHGSPKGEMDITGYPKEGASAGDLGGIISIRLLPQ